MKEYTLPDWIADFVDNKILKDLDKKNDAERKMILYGLGRIPLAEIQALVEFGIPDQDETGRYLKENPASGFPDELMRDIHTANGVQEILSNIVRKRPQRPFTFVPAWTPRQMEARIRARNWEHDCWGAGSHTSCDINILYMNVAMGLKQYRPALEAAMAVCQAYQSPTDGMWGLPQNEPHSRVNGTMKMLSRVHFVQECYLPFADKIIDYVLDYCEKTLPSYAAFSNGATMGCNLIDVLFCLKYAIKMTDHRREEISERCYSLFPLIKEMLRREDCSVGLAQGTIRRVALLCGLKDKLGWPEKVYRFPEAG